MSPAAILTALFIGIIVGFLWEAWHVKNDATNAAQAACSHTYGEPKQVIGTYFKRFCSKCGHQQNCDHTGKPM